jgi:hypothetical protein
LTIARFAYMSIKTISLIFKTLFMRNIFLALAILLFTASASIAQCDSKTKWQGAKGELVDPDGNVVDTKSATFVVIANAKTVSVEIVEEPGNPIDGDVSETTCEWKEAFKEGKSVYKTVLVQANGDSSPAVITIEGKDGKLTATLEIERMEGKKVRIYLDKYETL